MAFDPDATSHPGDATSGAALTAGQRVLGRYVLLAELGRGGMGVVWRAQDESLGETIALKFFPEFVARDAVALDELKHETRRAHRLTHPNIVRVHDFTQEGECAALSMECVDGATLTQRRLELPGRIFSIAALAPLVAQLCAALDYAHRTARIAHRDLKPANILVTRAGEVKVTDFGISRSLTETRTRLTMPGNRGVSGTLRYMSPQQLRGDKPLATDDIYALGATLYELLASKPPFHRGETESLMVQICERPPPSIAATRSELGVMGDPVPRAWEETIMACLAKQSDARLQNAADVAEGLGLNVGAAVGRASVPVHQELTSSDGAASRWGRQTLIAAGAAAILVAGAVLWQTTGADKVHVSRAPEPSRMPDGQELPLTTGKEATRPGPNQPPPSAAVAREFVVSVVPAEAEARLWLGPFAEIAVQGGHAVLGNVPDGIHELVVQAAGYEPFTAQVAVADGRGQTNVRLVRVKGSLEITGRPGTRVAAINAAGETTAVGTIGTGGVLAAEGSLVIGDYALRLEHDDCEPLEISRIALAVGRVTRLAPTQTPLPGELRVKSTPAGAEIRVNGLAVGRSPIVVQKLASEQSLRVEAMFTGHRQAEQNVRLAPKEQRELDFGALEPEAGSIALQVTSTPFPTAEATVTVDGIPVPAKSSGGGWIIANVVAGDRIVEIFHRDYEPWKQSVAVRDRHVSSVTAVPVAKPAVMTLDVTGPRNYQVLVEGNRVDTVNGRVTVPAQKSVVVDVRATGFRPVVGSIKLAANARGTLPITLEPQPMPKVGRAHENSLHMRFVPVPGLQVLFSIWETRVRDFELYFYATKQRSRLPAGKGVNDEPAVAMTWEEARGFCQWLTEVERSEGNLAPTQKYRLPTDQEWSVAVGLGTEKGKTPIDKNSGIREVYPWGKKWPPPARAGNYAGEETGPLGPRLMGYHDGFESVAPVGSFAANGFGLFDLGGNVWEWCDDEYQPGFGRRVVRGGSFRDYKAEILLSSARGNSAPTSGGLNLGFRCVLETGGMK